MRSLARRLHPHRFDAETRRRFTVRSRALRRQRLRLAIRLAPANRRELESLFDAVGLTRHRPSFPTLPGGCSVPDALHARRAVLASTISRAASPVGRRFLLRTVGQTPLHRAGAGGARRRDRRPGFERRTYRAPIHRELNPGKYGAIRARCILAAREHACRVWRVSTEVITKGQHYGAARKSRRRRRGVAQILTPTSPKQPPPLTQVAAVRSAVNPALSHLTPPPTRRKRTPPPPAERVRAVGGAGAIDSFAKWAPACGTTRRRGAPGHLAALAGAPNLRGSQARSPPCRRASTRTRCHAAALTPRRGATDDYSPGAALLRAALATVNPLHANDLRWVRVRRAGRSDGASCGPGAQLRTTRRDDPETSHLSDVGEAQRRRFPHDRTPLYLWRDVEQDCALTGTASRGTPTARAEKPSRAGEPVRRRRLPRIDRSQSRLPPGGKEPSAFVPRLRYLRRGSYRGGLWVLVESTSRRFRGHRVRPRSRRSGGKFPPTPTYLPPGRSISS